jgi:hypothetical protein
MAKQPCFFCGAPATPRAACTRCGMRPRILPSQRAAYRSLAGAILTPGAEGDV